MGITIAVMATTLVVASVPLGIVADRYGRKRLLVVGNLAASLSLIGFALTANLALILLAAVTEGIGEASFAVSVSALLTDKAGDDKRTLAFSLLAFLGWMAGALGAFAVASVYPLQSFGLSFGQAHVALWLIVGVIGLSITPLVLKIKEPPRPTIVVRPRRRGIFPEKSAKIMKRFTFCSVMIAAGAGLFVPLMTNWFSHAYGVADTISGPVLAVSGILTAFAVILSPRLAGKFGLVKAIVVTQGLSTVFMVMVPSAPNFQSAASIYTVRVFLMNLSNPLNQSLIMGLVSPDERGMASGLTASFWRLPNAITSSIGAYWIGLGLLGLPFYVATILYVSAIISFWLLFKDTRLPEEVRGVALPVAPVIQEEATASV
jgi:MFS family permease